MLLVTCVVCQANAPIGYRLAAIKGRSGNSLDSIVFYWVPSTNRSTLGYGLWASDFYGSLGGLGGPFDDGNVRSLSQVLAF